MRALRSISANARNRPFLPGFLVVSPQDQVKRQDSASAECSNGNDHALIAVRRTFPPVGPHRICKGLHQCGSERFSKHPSAHEVGGMCGVWIVHESLP